MPEFVYDGLPADVVVELRQKLIAQLRAAGQADSADAIGEMVEQLIRDEWGGFTMYIPAGTRYRTEWMRRQIAERWNGRNTFELAKELGISERNLRILAAGARDRDQADLFGPPDPQAAA